MTSLINSFIQVNSSNKQPPRIALFIHVVDDYGIGRVILNVTKGLVLMGYHVDWVVSRNNDSFKSKLPQNTRIIELKKSRLASDFSLISILEFAKYLRSEKPQSVISFLHYNNEIAILAKYLSLQPVKILVTDHSVLSENVKISNRKIKKLIPVIARLIYPFADEIIAVSKKVKNDLSNTLKINPDRINVIYNPIIEPNLAQKSKDKIEHPWFQKSDKPIVLAVGRLAYEKDFTTLIHAFAQVNKKIPSHLVILGDGSERNALFELANKLGITEDILFQGFVDNPYAYMSKADVLVLSSRWEGLSNVLIEALALNLPIVSTDCGGPREVLENGKYGSLVPIGDSAQMGQEIEKVLTQDKKPIPANWLSQFEISEAAANYLALINQKAKQVPAKPLSDIFPIEI